MQGHRALVLPKKAYTSTHYVAFSLVETAGRPGDLQQGRCVNPSRNIGQSLWQRASTCQRTRLEQKVIQMPARRSDDAINELLNLAGVSTGDPEARAWIESAL